MKEPQRHQECRLWHETLGLLGNCLSLFSKPFYQSCDSVMRKDDKRVNDLMEKIQVNIEQLYPKEQPLRHTDISSLVKRMKGLGKSNGLYKQELEDATTTMVFHSLLNKGYSLKEVKEIEDGMLITLREEWI